MKLSIITINRNNAEGLRKTIESVVVQTFTDFEYIVIDGASTDESVEVIKQYEDKITYWVSEPDKGIYNAMNKGILKSHGEYLQFLNSGDYLVDENVLKKIFDKDCCAGILYGDRIDLNNAGCDVVKFTDKLKFSFFVQSTLSHQASFFRKDCFDRFGLYEEQYKYASDWLLYMDWIFRRNVSYQYLNFPVVYYDVMGVSSLSENRSEMMIERENILIKEFAGFCDDMKELFALREQQRYLDAKAVRIGRWILTPLRRIKRLCSKICF